MPSIKAFFTNMSAPMPLHKKLYLVFRNNSIKIIKRQSCCGHPGEEKERIKIWLLKKTERSLGAISVAMK